MKLRVYQTYLRPWASKVGRLVPGGTVWVVDGFAGRGRYKTGVPGSPEIAMQEARFLAEQGRNFKLQCIFGETKPANQAVLRELRGLYPESSAVIIEDDFWRRTDDVVRFVGGSPVLLFIDPFGLLGIKFDRLAKLVQQLPRVDLIVNLRSPAAARLEANFRDGITETVGGVDWSLDTVGQTFRDNLQRAAGFLRPASLSVRDRLRGHIRSELILAARHPDAYELWNDQVIRETERLLGINDRAGQRASRDSELKEVLDRVVDWGSKQRGWWRRSELSDWYVVQFCGETHTGTIGRALDSLIMVGRIERYPERGPVERARFRIKPSTP